MSLKADSIVQNPIKTQWVAALKSGEYLKTYRRLRRDLPEGSGFCCLGVLCDLHAKATNNPAAWTLTPPHTRFSTMQKEYKYLETAISYPPKQVYSWLQGDNDTIPYLSKKLIDLLKPTEMQELKAFCSTFSGDQKWIAPLADRETGESFLMGLNDSGATHAQIAEVIEKWL